MLALARQAVPRPQEIRRLTLPDDPVPAADAIVGVGHALNYLPDAGAIDRALRAMAAALRPGGVLALDICDLEYGRARRDAPTLVRVEEDWAIITRFSAPSPDRFVRDMTTFVRHDEGTWRRDDERHDNVLIDTAGVARLLASEGVDAEMRGAFGSEPMPVGLRVVVGRRRA
jgi:SAM-dependent methyltransferase